MARESYPGALLLSTSLRWRCESQPHLLQPFSWCVTYPGHPKPLAYLSLDTPNPKCSPACPPCPVAVLSQGCGAGRCPCGSAMVLAMPLRTLWVPLCPLGWHTSVCFSGLSSGSGVAPAPDSGSVGTRQLLSGVLVPIPGPPLPPGHGSAKPTQISAGGASTGLPSKGGFCCQIAVFSSQPLRLFRCLEKGHYTPFFSPPLVFC